MINAASSQIPSQFSSYGIKYLNLNYLLLYIFMHKKRYISISFFIIRYLNINRPTKITMQAPAAAIRTSLINDENGNAMWKKLNIKLPTKLPTIPIKMFLSNPPFDPMTRLANHPATAPHKRVTIKLVTSISLSSILIIYYF